MGDSKTCEDSPFILNFGLTCCSSISEQQRRHSVFPKEHSFVCENRVCDRYTMCNIQQYALENKILFFKSRRISFYSIRAFLCKKDVVE